MKERSWLGLGFIAITATIALLCGFQNTGTSGTFTVAQKVTYTAGVSQIFQNIGQSAHWLTFCAGSGQDFVGTVDLEESFDGLTNWTPISFASYLATSLPKSTCATLQAGGYYQNIRSVFVVTSGTITASYNASSGPISFVASGISQFGPTPPTVCNQSNNIAVANGATVTLVFAIPATSIRVCAFEISLAAAPGSANFINFLAAPAAGCASSTSTVWAIETSTTMPTLFGQGTGVGQLFEAGRLDPTKPYLCLQNLSGQNLYVDLAYGQIFNGTN
jgi:hypothetical protein